MFHLFFQTYVASVFIWMLYIFLQWLFKRFQVFLQVFQTYVASVSTVFKRVLQVFHIDVAKVDLLFAHVVVGPICRNRLLCWARLHACGCGGVRAAGMGNGATADRDAAPCGRA